MVLLILLWQAAAFDSIFVPYLHINIEWIRDPILNWPCHIWFCQKVVKTKAINKMENVHSQTEMALSAIDSWNYFWIFWFQCFFFFLFSPDHWRERETLTGGSFSPLIISSLKKKLSFHGKRHYFHGMRLKPKSQHASTCKFGMPTISQQMISLVSILNQLPPCLWL